MNNLFTGPPGARLCGVVLRALPFFIIISILLCSCAPPQNGISVTGLDYDYRDGSSGVIPQVTGLNNIDVQNIINNELKFRLIKNYERIVSNSPGGNTDEGYGFFLSGSLLIIAHSGEYYIPGAAHGMPYRDYFHIDLNTGAFYDAKSCIKDRDAMDGLKEIITSKLKEQLGQDWMSYDVPMNSALFTLNDKSLRVVFAPYDVAPYALGFIIADIPFNMLDGMIDYESQIMRAYLN